MSSVLEAYLEREILEAALAAMTLCRAPHAFPSDRSALDDLIARVNESRAGTDASTILKGSPRTPSHGADELWLWFELTESAAIQVTAFQGIDQHRVRTTFDRLGRLEPFVLERRGAVDEVAVKVDVPRGPRQAEGLIFRMAIVALADQLVLSDAGTDLDHLVEIMGQRVGLPATLGPHFPADGIDGRVQGEIALGPTEEGRLFLQAATQGDLVSAWLTPGGSVVDLGSEVVVRMEPDSGMTTPD